MKIIHALGIALIASLNIGLAHAEKCSDIDAFLKSMPTRHGIANPCTYGATPTTQCQTYIDTWMMAMAMEKKQCEKRAGKS